MPNFVMIKTIKNHRNRLRLTRVVVRYKLPFFPNHCVHVSLLALVCIKRMSDKRLSRGFDFRSNTAAQQPWVSC